VKPKDIKFWSEVSEKIMFEAHESVKPLIGKKEAGEIVKMGADGTPTKLIDIVAEDKVVEVLKQTGRPVTLISEEIGELKIGDGPSEAVFVVDPLDGTRNALKNIPAYGISIAISDGSSSIQDMKLTDIEMGFVKNFANNDIYHAKKGAGAWLNKEKISPSNREEVAGSSIGAYIYRADMSKIDKLCASVRSMRILGSVAIELCYVANGTYDAFLDIRGNMRVMDIAAAKLIIEESHGLVTDDKCKPLINDLNVLERTSIVASCNKNFHAQIISILGGV